MRSALRTGWLLVLAMQRGGERSCVCVFFVETSVGPNETHHATREKRKMCSERERDGQIKHQTCSRHKEQLMPTKIQTVPTIKTHLAHRLTGNAAFVALIVKKCAHLPVHHIHLPPPSHISVLQSHRLAHSPHQMARYRVLRQVPVANSPSRVDPLPPSRKMGDGYPSYRYPQPRSDNTAPQPHLTCLFPLRFLRIAVASQFTERVQNAQATTFFPTSST